MIKQLYRQTPAAIATYDYVDISSGTGFVTYYGGNTITDYRLDTITFYSRQTLTSADQNGVINYTKILDLDFDIEFLKPQVVKGKTIINVPIGFQADPSGDMYFFPVAKVRKWDGTTETDLITNSGGILSKTSAAQYAYEYALCAIDVEIPKTHFKSGETLRLTIEGWAKDGGGGQGGSYFIGHDPQNRATTGFNAAAQDSGKLTFGSDVSKLVFQVPFKIDI